MESENESTVGDAGSHGDIAEAWNTEPSETENDTTNPKSEKHSSNDQGCSMTSNEVNNNIQSSSWPNSGTELQTLSVIDGQGSRDTEIQSEGCSDARATEGINLVEQLHQATSVRDESSSKDFSTSPNLDVGHTQSQVLRSASDTLNPGELTHGHTEQQDSAIQNHHETGLKLIEHPYEEDVLSLIPGKIHQGFRNVTVSVTCMDADGHFMLFGTNIGCAFLYNRENGALTKILCESRTDVVTSVKLLVGIECQVAVGTEDGKITILIVSNNTSAGRVVQKYSLGKIHDSSITCMEWSKNGLKLFSGDKNGNIYQVERDFEKGSCKVTFLHSENASIVDLSYRHMILLVSTTERTLLYHSSREDDNVKPVGSKTRQGAFGACFTPDSVSTSDLQVYCARPGYRIWIANIEGKVTNTILLKKLVSSSMTNIKMQKEMPDINMKDQQFRKIMFFNRRYLLAYSKTSVFVVDPSKPTILSSHQELPDILNVAMTTEEIFILRKEREFHRIAEKPDEVSIRRKRLAEEEKKSEGQALNLQDVRDSLSGVKKNLTPLVGALQSKMSSLNEGAGQWTQKLQSQAQFFQKKLSLFSREEKNSIELLDVKEPSSENETNNDLLNYQQDSNSKQPDGMELGHSDDSGSSRPQLTTQTSNGTQDSSSAQECEISNHLEADHPVFEPDSNNGDEKKKTVSPKTAEQDFLHSQGHPDLPQVVEIRDPKPSSVNFHFEKLERISSEGSAGVSDIVFVSKRKKKLRTGSASRQTSHQNNLTSDLHSSRTVADEDTNGERSGVKLEEHCRIIGNRLEPISPEAADICMDNLELSRPDQSPVLSEKHDFRLAPKIRHSHDRFSIPGVQTELESLKSNLATQATGTSPPSGSLPRIPEQASSLGSNNSDHSLSDLTLQAIDPSAPALKPSENDSQISIAEVENLAKFDPCHPEPPSSPTDQKLNFEPERTGSHLIPNSVLTDPEKADSGKSSPSSTNEMPSNSSKLIPEVILPKSQLKSDPSIINHEDNCTLKLARGVHENDLDPSSHLDSEPSRVLPGKIVASVELTDDTRSTGFVKVFPEKQFSFTSNNLGTQGDSASSPKETEITRSEPRAPLFSASGSESEEPKCEDLTGTDSDEPESVDIYNAYSSESGEDGDWNCISSNKLVETAGSSSEGFTNEMASIAASFPAKLFDSWSTSVLPHQVSGISGSNSYIWYTDMMHNIYITEQYGGKWVKLNKKGVELSISPSGDVVWLVTNFHKAYATVMPVEMRGDTLKLNWKQVDSGAVHATLGHDSAWLITTNGKIKAQFGISRSYPYSKSWTLVPWNNRDKISSIVATKSTVWCLTDVGKLFAARIDAVDSNDFKWEEVRMPPDTDGETSSVQAITSDSREILFVTDNRGILWFVTEGRKWWQIIVSEYLDNDSYTFVQSLHLPTKMTSSMYKVQRWMQGLVRAQFVAVNNQAIWIVHDKYKAAVARGPLTGQRWDVTTPLGVSKSSKWRQITTSSVFSPQRGSWIGLVWASRSNEEIHCFPSQDVTMVDPVTLEPPVQGRTLIASMSACKEALWVLLEDGSVYIRSGISADCIQGTEWGKLDISQQLGTAKFVHVSCGSQNVWTVDTSGKVYFRIGVTAVDSHSLPPAWIPIEGCPVDGHHFTQIECGSSDGSVWALDNFSEVYVRTGVSSAYPVGAKWEAVPGSHAQQLCISNHTVWGLRSGGNLIRRYGISERNDMGDYWKKIRGKFTKIAVTPYDELWGIDHKENLCHQYTTVYCPLVVEAQYQYESTNVADFDNSPPRNTDKEWEFL